MRIHEGEWIGSVLRLADAGALRRLVGEIRELKPLKLSDM
jgi:hypothetical protein